MSDEKSPIFPCNSCGKCCSNVHLSVETKYLDRGDGICRHLDIGSRQCLIYEKRPEICRVDLQYKMNYSHLYTWEQFIQINLSVCEILPQKL